MRKFDVHRKRFILQYMLVSCKLSVTTLPKKDVEKQKM